MATKAASSVDNLATLRLPAPARLEVGPVAGLEVDAHASVVARTVTLHRNVPLGVFSRSEAPVGRYPSEHKLATSGAVRKI